MLQPRNSPLPRKKKKKFKGIYYSNKNTTELVLEGKKDTYISNTQAMHHKWIYPLGV